MRSAKRAFRERFFELVEHRSEGWIEYLISSLGIRFRDVAFCPGNGASHAGDCVRIAADGNGQTNGVLEVLPFQVGPDRVWAAPLARDIKGVAWLDFVSSEKTSLLVLARNTHVAMACAPLPQLLYGSANSSGRYSQRKKKAHSPHLEPLAQVRACISPGAPENDLGPPSATLRWQVS